jgi:hypothetical protein
MSDALTDIARDERRAREFERFAELVLEHLRGKATVDAVKIAATDVDGVPRGYWGGQTSFADKVEVMLQKLRENDEATWLRWLRLINESWGLYDTTKEASPFKGKFIIWKRGRNYDCEDLAVELYTHGMKAPEYGAFIFEAPGRVVDVGRF